MKRNLMLVLLLLLLLLGFFISSCTNEVNDLVIGNDGVLYEAVSTRSVSNTLQIIYHGNVFETECVTTMDSCYYTNLDFNAIVSDLKDRGNGLVTFFHSDGKIELFDNQSDFELNQERLLIEHRKEKKSIFKQVSNGLFPEDNKPYLAPADPINNEVELHMYEDQNYWGDWTLLKRTKLDDDYSKAEKVWNYGGNATSMIVHTIGIGGVVYFL